jgi:hypothetical protein
LSYYEVIKKIKANPFIHLYYLLFTLLTRGRQMKKKRNSENTIQMILDIVELEPTDNASILKGPS